MQNGRTQHVVLVPGFGGFDALGTLRYYHGVTGVLRGRGCVLHYFPNLPTASVQTRAQRLAQWLAAQWERGALDEDCDIHFVGHSTGGLDLRQLLLDWQQRASSSAAGAEVPVFECIRSMQFLSTPHRGTSLAQRLSRTRLRTALCRVGVRGLYEMARLMREWGVGQMGQILQGLMSGTARSDWIDALVDTSASCFAPRPGLESAMARAHYFELLRWLLHVASDFSAIHDLSPLPPRGRKALLSPAHREEKPDLELMEKHGVRVRSIVTVATPVQDLRPLELYKVLYLLTAYRPPERFRPLRVPELGKPGRRLLQPSDNDGIVNSVSQVWPDEDHSFVVEADHADVIGHYEYCPPSRFEPLLPAYRQYDLLASQTGFGAGEFTELWEDIGDFVVRPPAMHPPEEERLIRSGPAEPVPAPH